MKSRFTLLFLFSSAVLFNSCSPKETPRPAPKAAFSWSSAGEGVIQFTDQSTETDSYAWNFGDGSPISTDKNPKHRFEKNTKYTVTLNVKNQTASDQTGQEVELTTIKPIVDFTWIQTDGHVTFTNNTKNADSYSWDFGNGKTSTEVNPTTRYLKAGTYPVNLIGKGKGGEMAKTASVVVTSVVLTLADAVDDQTLVDYLPGVWGSYYRGNGERFSNDTYEFSRVNNMMKYESYYNSYEYINSPKTLTINYKFSIADKIIYKESLNGKPEKYARFQVLSDDEMKVYRITETSSSYSELLPEIFTRTSDIEKPISAIINSTTLLTILKGIWDQGGYSIYTDVAFDFSSQKNYYHYSSTFQGAKSINKYEFKIDADNVMSYRKWNSDFDPAWKKYKVEVVSNSMLKLYPVDNNGKVSSQVEYTLKKR